MESASTRVDMTDPELWRHPGAYFEDCFARGVRAGQVQGTGSVMLFHHADVRKALVDSRLGAMGTRALESMGWDGGSFVDWMRNNIVAMDPPAHTRLRALVSRAFTPRRVAELEPLARRVANELVDEMISVGEVDFYSSFAQRFPLNIICSMLGIPDIDHSRMQIWTEAINEATGLPSESARDAADAAVSGMVEYVGGLIGDRRVSPGEDLISGLIHAQEDGESLNDTELSAMVIQLLVAGHETTRNLIGNGLFTLICNPGQWRCLREDPSLISNAVEEMIRIEPSLIWVARTPLVDFEFDGIELERDRLVLLNLAAANRDPSIHPDPNRFDVTRKGIQVLSFGLGPHFCLGASLARLEGRIAFEVLLDRVGQVEFAGETPRFAAFTALRTLESMKVCVTSA